MAGNSPQITENVRKGVALREQLQVRFEIVEGLEEARAKKRGYLMKVRAHLADADMINENVNLYSLPVLTEAASELDATLDEGKARGLDGHPTATTPRGVGNSVFLWRRLWMEGRALKGEATIFNTAAGRDVAAVIAGEGAVPLSLRGRGDMVERKLDESSPFYATNTEHLGRAFTEVTALHLKTFDSVDAPGFKAAGVRSVEEMRAIVESLDALAAQEHSVPNEEKKKGTESQQDPPATESKDETLESVKAELEEAKKAEAKLKEDNEKLREAAETKAEETAKAIEEAKEELKAGMLSDEERAKLESLKDVDVDKLNLILSIVEAKTDNPDPEKTPEQMLAEQLEKRDLVHQTRIDALEEENKKLRESMEAEKLEREKALQKAKLDAHVVEAVRSLPEASREKWTQWLSERCGTPEDVDREMKGLLEDLGLKAIVEGREDPDDDKAKGSEAPSAGSYSLPASGSSDALDKYVAEHKKAWLAREGVAVNEEVAS